MYFILKLQWNFLFFKLSHFNYFCYQSFFIFLFQKVAVSNPTLMNDANYRLHFLYWKKKNNLYIMRIKWNLRKFKIYFDHTDGNCVFPSTWNSTWYDSSMGDVIMSNSSSAITSGWTVTAYSVPVTSWTCVSENTTDSIMLFKWDFNISKLLNINNEISHFYILTNVLK